MVHRYERAVALLSAMSLVKVVDGCLEDYEQKVAANLKARVAKEDETRRSFSRMFPDADFDLLARLPFQNEELLESARLLKEKVGETITLKLLSVGGGVLRIKDYVRFIVDFLIGELKMDVDKSDLVTFMKDSVASRCDHAPFRDFITVFLIVCLNLNSNR